MDTDLDPGGPKTWILRIRIRNTACKLQIIPQKKKTQSFHEKHCVGPITKHGDIDYEAVVKLSDGFNGADLRNVCTEAGLFAIR
jgi:ATP-dependent 26S proteasome regulatory subunit